jgi:hypothetical protein
LGNLISREKAPTEGLDKRVGVLNWGAFGGETGMMRNIGLIITFKLDLALRSRSQVENAFRSFC